MKKLAKETCVLCGLRKSSPNGEHVPPEWFTAERFPDEEGPYTALVGGTVVTKRDGGTPRRLPTYPRAKLPVCSPCNGTLNTRFEQPAKQAVRELFESQGNVDFSAETAATVGLWLLKTWLFLGHPELRDSDPARQQHPDAGGHPLDRDPDLWTWTVRDGEPPDGLSLWAARVDDDLESPEGAEHLVALPRISVAGTEAATFQFTQSTIEFLDVSVVYHPGWAIAHPLASEGSVVQLWPPNGGPALLSEVPAVHRRAAGWIQLHHLNFAPGGYPGPDLPPLSSTMIDFASVYVASGCRLRSLDS